MSRKEEMTRREFVRKAATAVGSAAVGIGALSRLLEGSETAAGTGPPSYDWNKHDYLMLIDTTRCIGCGSCVRACAQENNVPEHFFRTWVERYRSSSRGHVKVDCPNGGMDGFRPDETGYDVKKGFFVPKLCNHCEFAPCVQLCPVGASYRTRDGVVMVDQTRCIGCGYCIQACPYGSRFLDPVTHTAHKCTLCYHRVTRGLQTACVQVCPVGARMLGDAKNPRDPVANKVASERVTVLQAELLTGPRCYYLGLDGEVI